MDQIGYIDVIIPVYRGLAETRACVESVLSNAQASPFELIVIDDASPDSDLVKYLDGLATKDCITLIRNETNLGFVRSVNKGMSQHLTRDVVLLNSDTVVTNDWLDRMRECAISEKEIGTITPFSNNATICSYPIFCVDNPLPEDLTLNELDHLFRRINKGKYLTIPTAVGFCMYIKRACLNEVGLFDSVNFGMGYGEENDFSLRAAAAGWRNVLCADTFVYHAGGVSFQAKKDENLEKGLAAMHRLHPDYQELVRTFLANDPIRELRDSIDAERARLSLKDF